MFRSAVYYKFMVVGEALSQLRAEDPDTLQLIQESDRIIAFRNQVVHGYRVIADDTTWKIISKKLPILRADLDRLGI